MPLEKQKEKQEAPPTPNADGTGVKNTTDAARTAAMNVLQSTPTTEKESASAPTQEQEKPPSNETATPTPPPAHRSNNTDDSLNPVRAFEQWTGKLSGVAPEVTRPSLPTSATMGAATSTIPLGAVTAAHAAAYGGVLGGLGAGAGMLALPYLGYLLGKRFGMPVAGTNAGIGAAAATAVGMSAPGIVPVASMAGLTALPAIGGYVGTQLAQQLLPDWKYSKPVGAVAGAGAGAAGVWAGLNALSPVGLSAAAMGGSVAALSGIPILSGYAGHALGKMVGKEKAGAVLGAAAGGIGSMMGVAGVSGIPLSLAGAGAIVNAPLAAGIVGGLAVAGGTLNRMGRLHEKLWGIQNTDNGLMTLARSLALPGSLLVRGLEGINTWAWNGSKRDVEKQKGFTRVWKSIASVVTTPIGLAWEKIPSATKKAGSSLYRKTLLHIPFDWISDAVKSSQNIVQDRNPETVPGAIVSNAARSARWTVTRSDSPHAATLPAKIVKEPEQLSQAA